MPPGSPLKSTTATPTTSSSSSVRPFSYHTPAASLTKHFYTHTDGDQLYNGVRTLVIEHLDRLAEEKIVPTFPRSGGTRGAGKLGGGAEAVERATEGDRFLKAVKGVWEDHTGSMRKLKDVLKYMASHRISILALFGLGFNLSHRIKCMRRQQACPQSMTSASPFSSYTSSADLPSTPTSSPPSSPKSSSNVKVSPSHVPPCANASISCYASKYQNATAARVSTSKISSPSFYDGAASGTSTKQAKN